MVKGVTGSVDHRHNTEYRIEFTREPVQTTSPRVGVSSSQEQSLINKEIQKMLSKGAITELSLKEMDQGFFSSLFLVPKKDGGMRPVINLKSLYEYVHVAPINSRWREFSP